MLTNQTFTPPPLIAVSEQLFESQFQALGIDYDVVNSFRRKIQVSSAFQFLFVSESARFEHYEGFLKAMNVHFKVSQLLVAGNPQSERDMVGLLSTAEFVWAPKLSSYLNLPVSKAPPVSKAKFVACLELFSSYDVPFTKTNFLNQLSNI